MNHSSQESTGLADKIISVAENELLEWKSLWLRGCRLKHYEEIQIPDLQVHLL